MGSRTRRKLSIKTGKDLFKVSKITKRDYFHKTVMPFCSSF